jgi:uncharacterized membrane-anchored protein
LAHFIFLAAAASYFRDRERRRGIVDLYAGALCAGVGDQVGQKL